MLFDVFPDGREVLGGAPFNVAWNLRGFGLDPLLICRVGRDRRGDAILAAMEDWGLDRAGTQIDPDRPTGTVRITLDDGQPSYDIVPDQAFDVLDGRVAERAVAAVDAAMLVRGTLGARSERGRAAIERLERAIDAPVLLDVNLRAPWWDAESVVEAIGRAAIAKLNEHELLDVLDEGHRRRGKTAEAVDAARNLRRDHGLDAVVLTQGADGAAWIDRDRVHRSAARPPSRFVDAVGAGDAFTAVVVAGLGASRPPEAILERAAEFAAEVCGIQGATHRDPEFYRDVRHFATPGDLVPGEARPEGGSRG